MRFHPGAGFCHLLLWRNGPVTTTTIPPHDVWAKRVEYNLPQGGGGRDYPPDGGLPRDSPESSRQCRASACSGQIRRHPDHGSGARGAGPFSPSFRRLYGLTGGVISAVDLVRRIRRLAGLDAPHIPGPPASWTPITPANLKRRAPCWTPARLRLPARGSAGRMRTHGRPQTENPRH